MTLVDLVRTYENAADKCFIDWMKNDLNDISISEAMKQAGVRAVVRALRDEFKCWIDADKMFMTILGSDAGEKAAGSSGVGSNPALAADPKLCVWTPRRSETGFYNTKHGVQHRSYPFPECLRCGLPIKFQEQQP